METCVPFCIVMAISSKEKHGKMGMFWLTVLAGTVSSLGMEGIILVLELGVKGEQ